MIKISRNTGNIKLTGLDLWQPTFPQLCRAFSTPKIDTDKLNAGFSVHDVLIRNGYKQQGKRYLHPNSASKIAGVRILDTGRAYSDSSDSLNDGKSHDAFDCYRLLECGGDMKAALNWNRELTKQNQRAFYEVPEPKNPRDIAIGAGSHNLLESAPCTRSPAINTLISIG